MYDVFISYSHRDKAIVTILCEALNDQGISYYIDRQSQEQQNELPMALVKAISGSRTLLFVASQNSYDSPFAVKEVVYAFNHMPIENIVVYKVDDAPLPPNIDFITHNQNVIEAKDEPIREELIKRLCKLLKRDMQEVDWDSYEPTRWINTDTGVYISLAISVLLTIGVAVGVGYWLESVLMGIGTTVGMAGVCIAVFFSYAYADELPRYTTSGKVGFWLYTLLGIAGSLMMPVSTWLGLRAQSWGIGLLWAIGFWAIIVLLMSLVGSATSHISVGRAPLMKRRRWGKTCDFYLCYHKKDRKMVERIHTELLRNGLTFLEGGTGDVKRSVDACRGFLYIGSRNSYRDDHCNQQLAYGFSHRRPILAYAIDQTEMPEDKKMVFSNSNVLSLKTHPIETKLMTDLKMIIEESNQGGLNIGSSFWRSLALTVSYTAAIASIFFFGYLMGSVALSITITFNLLTAWVEINEAHERRMKYVKTENFELTLLECSFIMMMVGVPLLIWWLLEPGWVFSCLLVLPVWYVMSSLGDAYEYAAKTSPVGKLSPTQVQQYFDVFISYSRKDTAVADEMCAMLDRRKMSYFIDRQGIPGGSEFPTVLAEAIQNCAVVLFLMSENSALSKFCQQEITYTEEHKRASERVFFYLDAELYDRVKDYISANEKRQKKFEKETLMVMTDGWQDELYYQLTQMIPKTRQALSHKQQLHGSSRTGLMKFAMGKLVKDNPITAATVFTIIMAYVTSHYTHSWTVGLAVYSVLEPLLYYLASHRRLPSDALTLSGAFITSGITVGLLVSSLWWGIGTCLLITIVAMSIGNKEEEK